MKDLNSDKRLIEEKEFQHFTGSENYVEVLLDANEVGIHLQSRLRVTAKVKADQIRIKGEHLLFLRKMEVWREMLE